MLGEGERLALVIGLGAGFLPIWGSGMNRGLNFYQFMWNHTVWGPRPMYVPKEFTPEGMALFNGSTDRRISGILTAGKVS